MNAKNWICSTAVAMVAVFGGAPVQASIMITPPAPSRYVASAVTSGFTGATVAGPFTSSTAFGLFSPAPSSVSSVGGPLGIDSATATQSSLTPSITGSSISGGGTATASVTWVGPSGYSVTADSFFDVFFEVDLPGTFNLSGVVDSGGTFPPGSGIDSAEVKLVDNALPGSPLFLEGTNPGDPGPDPFNVNLSLTPGITYRLTARALVSRGGPSGVASADASWNLNLEEVAVPEPSTFVLAALGLLGLGCVALRKKYRRA